MPTVRLVLEYDGSEFAGWAKQRGLRTVEGVLEEAASLILQAPVELTVAGRTDRGVHAWKQVASFDAPRVPLVKSLNGVLPPDIAVLSAEQAAEGFDARKDALSRTYCYRVLARRPRSALERGRALWWPLPIDRAALDACAAALPGTHDFTAFTPTETYHVRFERDVFHARWEAAAGDVLEFWIEADTFMRHMNRVLVGTMLEVAAGRRTLEDFERLLRGAHRREAGETAHAHGLALARVSYGSERTGPVATEAERPSVAE
jgi:tRNA pseudouridine38-40 synthase